jgi:restriction system protein
MFGFGAFGELAFGEGPRDVAAEIARGAEFATLILSSVIVPERKVSEGLLIRGTSAVWAEIVAHLSSDWSLACQIPPEKWEEIVAGAFKKAGYDDVTCTPRSRDHGRDIIAFRHGIGSVKILGSVKAYAPGHLVRYDDVRALFGVVSSDQAASKSVLATTSDFPPAIMEDPFIAPLVPHRIELLNGKGLQQWLSDLANKG